MKMDVVDGKVIRFAPARSGAPLTRPWKLWIQGIEIYTLGQSALSGAIKISVHASGQIHFRLGPKQKRDVTPLRQIGVGSWYHALQIRFLPSVGAKAPRIDAKILEKKSCLLLPLPNDHILIADILVGTKASNGSLPPAPFDNGQILWRRRLSDGRFAVLVGRVLLLDAENRAEIKDIRETRKLTANFTSSGDLNAARESAYVEIHHIHWSPEGNLISVIPLGEEAIRIDRDEWEPLTEDADIRTMRYRSPRASTPIIAPDGAAVAILEIVEVDKEIELIKTWSRRHVVGSLKMKLRATKLIAGNKFITAPSRLFSLPSINGGSPNNWEYTATAQFDGFSLSVEIRSQSASLQNKNLLVAMNKLGSHEELLISIPFQSVQLTATLESLEASAELIGRFTLRNQ